MHCGLREVADSCGVRAGLGRFHFDGDEFVYEDSESGRVTAIRGYPVKQLLRVLSAA